MSFAFIFYKKKRRATAGHFHGAARALGWRRHSRPSYPPGAVPNALPATRQDGTRRVTVLSPPQRMNRSARTDSRGTFPQHVIAVAA